ncbi:MAG: hypothetical protein ABI353_22275, partial [Isosphaeraceae bacterium]
RNTNPDFKGDKLNRSRGLIFNGGRRVAWASLDPFDRLSVSCIEGETTLESAIRMRKGAALFGA